MAKSNLYAAHGQWANRPADERFWTLSEARETCKAYADTAEEVEVDFGVEALMHDEDNHCLDRAGAMVLALAI